MKKLHELLGLPLCKGDIGVEVEVEGENLYAIDTETWRTEDDGSLRGKFPSQRSEYVMKQPVAANAVDKAISSLVKAQKNATLNFSFRTSVHVHINVQELAEQEMLAFLYLCLLLEEPLMNYCGEERQGNRFCLRLRDAEGYDETLNKLFSHGYRYIRDLHGDAIRYSAINIHALRKYGSIEFRGMRGTLDEDVLRNWTGALLQLRDKAVEYGSPVAVYNDYIGKENTKFFADCFGKYADAFNYPELEGAMNQSFSLTLDLPHRFKNRKAYAEPVVGVAHDYEVPRAFNAPPPALPCKRSLIETLVWPRVEKQYDELNTDHWTHARRISKFVELLHKATQDPYENELIGVPVIPEGGVLNMPINRARG